MRRGPPYPDVRRKWRLNGRFLGITVKRLTPCRCFDEHTKEPPYEISMAWEPERRSNFYSPPAHVCAVTCITEISLIVTLSNQYSLHILACYSLSRY